MMNLQQAARALGGEVSGRQVVCPGPGHGPQDRSLAVRFEGNGFVCHSFAGDDFRDCRDHVRDVLGLGDGKPMPIVREEAPDTARALNRQFADALWREAEEIAGTPAEAYLIGRGVSYHGPALRWHPYCPFGKGERHGCMLARMVDPETNEFRGVQRTRISPKERMMLGNAGVVKLTSDAEVTGGLHIAEGVETGLALLGMGFAPLWATLSANAMAIFPVLAGVEALTIFADNDNSGTGEQAARECAARWREAGREVRVFMAPQVGADFADWSASA